MTSVSGGVIFKVVCPLSLITVLDWFGWWLWFNFYIENDSTKSVRTDFFWMFAKLLILCKITLFVNIDPCDVVRYASEIVQRLASMGCIHVFRTLRWFNFEKRDVGEQRFLSKDYLVSVACFRRMSSSTWMCVAGFVIGSLVQVCKCRLCYIAC